MAEEVQAIAPPSPVLSREEPNKLWWEVMEGRTVYYYSVLLTIVVSEHLVVPED